MPTSNWKITSSVNFTILLLCGHTLSAIWRAGSALIIDDSEKGDENDNENSSSIYLIWQIKKPEMKREGVRGGNPSGLIRASTPNSSLSLLSHYYERGWLEIEQRAEWIATRWMKAASLARACVRDGERERDRRLSAHLLARIDLSDMS